MGTTEQPTTTVAETTTTEPIVETTTVNLEETTTDTNEDTTTEEAVETTTEPAVESTTESNFPTTEEPETTTAEETTTDMETTTAGLITTPQPIGGGLLSSVFFTTGSCIGCPSGNIEGGFKLVLEGRGDRRCETLVGLDHPNQRDYVSGFVAVFDGDDDEGETDGMRGCVNSDLGGEVNGGSITWLATGVFAPRYLRICA